MSLKQDLEQLQHQSDHSSDRYSNPPPQRRPRGFAAAAAAAAAVAVGFSTTPPPVTAVVAVKGRKEREKEKERTKLRERHRRAITSRMLAGLRQHGNFPLPARADMNDVLAALAREAGWTVNPDGTTYRQSLTPPPPPLASAASLHPPSQLAPPVRSIESSLSATSLKNRTIKASLDSQTSFLRIDESLSPSSLDSVVVVAERDSKNDNYTNSSPINSPECVDAEQLMRGALEHDGDFAGTPYIPVYVTLATCLFNNYCQLVDPEIVRQELGHLRALHIDGIVVDCWWGFVEGWSPNKYQWSGYRDLFNIIREFKLKMQVVMAFHEYCGKESGDIVISLPKWILEIGQDNQDIFFTDREGRRNTECLSCGIDRERVLKGRTGIEVYFDFMRSFRMEFDDLFEEGLISAVEIGLGPSGELKYPSHSEKIGWRYPGIGEFQCYDKYMQQNLRRAARVRGHSFWARGPDNAGHYNSRPHETGFFCDRGDYDSYYGRFFLRWYSQTLIDHADQVLSLASLAFEGTQLVVKIPSIYWWYRTSSHAPELTAGYYNPTNQDGYSPVFEMLKKHSSTVKFTFLSQTPASAHQTDDAWSDLEGQSWQVLNSAWDQRLAVAGLGNFQCHDRDACIRALETAKPRNDPDRHHLSLFTYQALSPIFMQGELFLSDIDGFIKSMHGEILSVDVAV
ncbi:Beta-amylase 8 [Platanthera zijinensis]|uniref:Beta-amylase n=1 Tax=Platanthera zijinensis TaxID=2320716 RepID=A0AAP0AUD4_9ASPA